MRQLLFLILLCHCGTVLAFPWSKDMVDQPSIKPQEALVREASDSVPDTGKEAMPVPTNIAEVVRSRLDAASKLSNPEAADQESLTLGKVLYETHCLVCHGVTGKGDGPVGQKFVPPPMDLTTDYVQSQGDGQIFYTITHGGIAMPFYRDAIEAGDRWHLVNYVKNELKPE